MFHRHSLLEKSWVEHWHCAVPAAKGMWERERRRDTGRGCLDGDNEEYGVVGQFAAVEKAVEARSQSFSFCLVLVLECLGCVKAVSELEAYTLIFLEVAG